MEDDRSTGLHEVGTETFVEVFSRKVPPLKSTTPTNDVTTRRLKGP